MATTNELEAPAVRRGSLRAIRWITICLSLVLAGAHLAFPGVYIDSIAIGLFVIALVAFVAPALTVLFPHLRRFRLGSFELELAHGIAKLAGAVDHAKETSPMPALPPSDQGRTSRVEEVIKEAAQDPRAALLLLSTKIETALRELASRSGIFEARRGVPLPILVRQIADSNQLDPAILPAFRDFWAIRNRIAHEAQFNVPDRVLYSLIDLGADILQMLEASSVEAESSPGSG